MDKIQKIQEQIAALQKEADQLIAQQRAEVIDAIKSQIKTYGLTAKDLGLLERPSSRVGMVVPVKYRLNDDTWTGRGRKPKWLEDCLSQGGNLETLRVV